MESLINTMHDVVFIHQSDPNWTNVKYIDLTNPVCEEQDDCSLSVQPFAYAIEMKEHYWAFSGSDVDEVAKFCPQTITMLNLKEYL